MLDKPIAGRTEDETTQPTPSVASDDHHLRRVTRNALGTDHESGRYVPGQALGGGEDCCAVGAYCVDDRRCADGVGGDCRGAGQVESVHDQQAAAPLGGGLFGHTWQSRPAEGARRSTVESVALFEPAVYSELTVEWRHQTVRLHAPSPGACQGGHQHGSADQGSSEMMRAWRVEHPGPVGSAPLRLGHEPIPVPAVGELLVRVLSCGVCRTDLHVVEGDLPVHRQHVTPGHEVVAEVVSVPDGCTSVAVGDRVGVPWLRYTCGECRYCLRGAENLCPRSRYTGWDADGGYAEFATVPTDFALPLPTGYRDDELAPLLCAGIIGYHALIRAEVPEGGVLGIYGFGGSAHLTAQIALARGARVHVMTRDAAARELALALGADSVQGAADAPPEPLDSAILFAPVGALVLPAMAALDAGGTLAVAGIHLTDVPPLNYQRHLFRERQIRSVTSNTRAQAREFLELAQDRRLAVSTHRYPLDHADRALSDLSLGRFDGAAVLVP